MIQIENKVIKFILGEDAHPEGYWYQEKADEKLAEKHPKRYWWRNYVREEVEALEAKVKSLKLKLKIAEDAAERKDKILKALNKEESC